MNCFAPLAMTGGGALAMTRQAKLAGGVLIFVAFKGVVVVALGGFVVRG